MTVLRRASLLHRAAAGVLDLAAIFYLRGAALAAHPHISIPVAGPAGEWVSAALWWMLPAIVPLAYVLPEAVWGTTPGKFLLRLRVASADRTRAPLTRLVPRWCLKYAWLLADAVVGTASFASVVIYGTHVYRDEATHLPVLVGILFLATVGGLVFPFGDGRQSIYDRITSTAVFPPRDVQRPPTRGFEVESPRPDPHDAMT